MALVASHQSVETPQQEVWLYPHHLGLWKELGFCDVLQLVHPRHSVYVRYAARVLESWLLLLSLLLLYELLKLL